MAADALPHSIRSDDAARRAYWAAQMEEAHAFMQAVLSYPVEECGEPLVSLVDASARAGVDVAFSPRPHALGLPRLFYLRAGQIDGFLGACREMNRRGWAMRVEDGYRTRAMQAALGRQPAVFDALLATIRWELGGAIPDPGFFLRRSMALVALMPKVGTHMSGSAIDISVLDARTRAPLDTGAGYLELSELTPMDSPFIPAAARATRAEITVIMRRHGFVTYPWEFWHYNSGDAYQGVLERTGRPARYGAVDWSGPGDPRVAALADAAAPLNSPEVIDREIAASLARPAGAG